MQTLEQYIYDNLERCPRISYSKGKFKVRLLGSEVVKDGRKTREKSVRGLGKTPVEAFEDAISLLKK